MRRAGFVVALAVVALGLLIGITLSVGAQFLLYCLGAIGVWVLFSVRIIGPDEMAVLVLFGKPVAFRDSGTYFVPLFLRGCGLRRYSKKVFNFSYPGRPMVSMAGEYKGISYGALVLYVGAVAYISFPEGDGLTKILQKKVPTGEKELRDWIGEAVVSALREALGRFTWKEAMENMADVRRTAEIILRHQDGSLRRVGFLNDDIQLVIVGIDFPREIEEILPLIDQTRIEVEAAGNRP